MKSIKIFATVGAIALLGMTGLTSCNQKNGPVDPGTYNGETVKTEILISLPDEAAGGGNARYMPGTTVQKEGRTQFQGMTNIILVPFAKSGTAIASADPRLGKNISLADIASVDELGAVSNAKNYVEKEVPIGTASFLFYGKSKATGDKYQIGSLSMTGQNANTPNGFEFALEYIRTDALFGDGKPGQSLLDYLTHVACVNDGSGHNWYDAELADPVLKALFDKYKSMHGLSSFEVARVMSDLYTSLHPLYGVNTLAKNICDKIADSTNEIVSNVAPKSEGSDIYVVTLKSTPTDYTNFPQALGLPQGSVEIVWDATNHEFKEGDYSSIGSPYKYTYPAELWYYANSFIKTSNSSKATWYDDTNDWGTILSKYENGVAAVNTNTRAIAIQDTIQYGVARLDVSVQLNGANLDDNSEAATGYAHAVDCSLGFPVTAVIVGGQRKANFDFTPKGEIIYAIYDSVMALNTMKAIYGSASALNHTLVLESPASENVNVAVEMINTAADFYGIDNQLIPHGGRFYVVGELPYANAVKTAGKIFKQDYVTTANFTLSNLKKAYNTIPDLRTPKLEIGFSVNLSWKVGDVHNITIQ